MKLLYLLFAAIPLNAQPLRPITRMHSFDFAFRHTNFIQLPKLEEKILSISLPAPLEIRFPLDERPFYDELLEHLSVHNLWKIFDGGK